jgi:hypothetical protein
MGRGGCKLGRQGVGLGEDIFVSSLQVFKKEVDGISNKLDSLSAFVERKMESSIPSTSDYRDLWERVICPTIQNKYVTIQCNLMNDTRTTYRGEYGDECLSFVRMISQSFVRQRNRGSEPEKGGPGHSGK